MDLKDYIDKECIAVNKQFVNWEDAISYSGKLMEKNKVINGQYTLDMIELVNKCGPYIVVMPGVALAHARPNGNVNKNCVSIVTLKDGVKFGHGENDPVKVIFAIAATTDDEHLKLFQAIANYLMINGNLEKILNSKDIDELIGGII